MIGRSAAVTGPSSTPEGCTSVGVDWQQERVPVAIRVAWDRDDPRMIWAVFEGPWTLQEFHTAGEQVMALANVSPQPVGVIMDISAAPQLPGDFVGHAAKIVERARSKPSDSVAIYTVLGASPFIQAMYHAFFRVFNAPIVRQRFVLVGCAEEARALITALLGAQVEAVYD